MSVNAADLPPDVRARLGLTDPARSREKSRPTKAGSYGWDLLCTVCGYKPTSDAKANAHTTELGHSRWELPLGP